MLGFYVFGPLMSTYAKPNKQQLCRISVTVHGWLLCTNCSMDLVFYLNHFEGCLGSVPSKYSSAQSIAHIYQSMSLDAS